MRYLHVQKAKTEQPKQAKARTETMAAPQLRTPRGPDSQRTVSRKYTNNMPLIPVNTASITADKPVANEGVPRRIECCCTFKSRLL